VKSAIVLVGNIFAVIVYALGLIGPLTPSSGTPSVSEILTFAGFLAAALLLCARHYRCRTARIAALFQMAFIVLFTAWLLWSQLSTT
jgi:hypothetical protein